MRSGGDAHQNDSGAEIGDDNSNGHEADGHARRASVYVYY